MTVNFNLAGAYGERPGRALEDLTADKGVLRLNSAKRSRGRKVVSKKAP